MSYWDTSSVGKLYFAETDSAAFEQKALSGAGLITSKLAWFEMRRVAFRKESDGVIPTGSAEVFLCQLDRDIASGTIRILEINPQVETEFNTIMAHCYRHTPPISLRTFDAVHLASARVAGETEIVATDKRLRQAAKLLGFSLFPL